MSSNLKIGLALGILTLFLGLGYFMITERNIEDFLSQSPLPSTSAEPEVGSVDDFIASLESDSYSENILSQEESASIDQSMSSESQAVSDFGQSYDANEL